MLRVGVCTCIVDWLCWWLAGDCESECEDECDLLGVFLCVEVPVPLAGLLVVGVCHCHVVVQSLVWWSPAQWRHLLYDSKTVEGLGSFFVDPWTLQFDVCACFAVVCWCICPVCVLLFYIWNNKEFQDNFSSSDPAGCSRNKAFILLPWLWFTVLHLTTICRFGYTLLFFICNGRLGRWVNICFNRWMLNVLWFMGCWWCVMHGCRVTGLWLWVYKWLWRCMLRWCVWSASWACRCSLSTG